MNHFMKYDESADINPSVNEFNMASPMSGAAAQSQQRFDQRMNKAKLLSLPAAQLMFKNLTSILANDPKAEQKKVKIVKLLYKWIVQGDQSVTPEDQAEE